MFSFIQTQPSEADASLSTATTTETPSHANTVTTGDSETATTTADPPIDEPVSKTKHLQDIESTEKDMTSSLQKQLEHARETAASLKGGATDDLQSLDSQNPEDLKRALAEALEKQKQHEALIKRLRHEVDVERGHATILRHDNQVLRHMKANMHAVAEQEEENISNRLLKRISGLKKEKGELMLQVEQEEEYLTKTLQKKLSQLQKEKIDMENALEQEQEYIVNRLQKQLDALRMEQSTSTSAASSWQDKDHLSGGGLPIAIGSSPINIAGGGRSSRINPNPSPTPSPTHKKWIPSHSPSSSEHQPTHPIVDMLRAELTAAKATLNELEREYLIKFKQCNRYRSEVLTLRQELGLPVASDLLVEDSLPTVLSSTHRTGGTPSRRNSSTSVSSSRGASVVPATPTNTPANPAPISNHHFSSHRAVLSPHNPANSLFAPPGSLNHYSTSPTLSTFPGGNGSNHGNGGAAFSSSAAAAAIAAAAAGNNPHSHSHYAHREPYSSGTNSFSSSVGSLGSTSPMLSMASSLSSTSGLPAIVPERQSLYRSKSSSRQHAQYAAPQQQSYQAYHHHQQQHQQQPSQPSNATQ
ncbi:hypothetical protein CPB97_009047 [Podila verticillata]|nr:hypothetical protein CPB97_009047 [Podila verticillata]